MSVAQEKWCYLSLRIKVFLVGCIVCFCWRVKEGKDACPTFFMFWFHVCWQTLCALRVQARSIHFQKESRQFFLESTLVPRRPFSSNYINYIVQSSKLALYCHTNSTIDYSNVKDSQPFATFDGCCRGQACASTHQTLRMNFAQRQGISISKLISCVTLWCLCCVFRFASIHQMQASHCLSSVRWQRLPREWWSELGKDSAVSGGKNQLQSIIMKCWTASNFEAKKTCLDTKQTIMFSLKDIEFCPVKTFHCF